MGPYRDFPFYVNITRKIGNKIFPLLVMLHIPKIEEVIFGGKFII